MSEVKNGLVVDDDGNKYWYCNDVLHREDGPAVINITSLNVEVWWVNGVKHREDGPAIVYANGDKEWFLNGKMYSEDDFKHEMQKRELNHTLHSNLAKKQKGILVKI